MGRPDPSRNRLDGRLPRLLPGPLALAILLVLFGAHFHASATWVFQKLGDPIERPEDLWAQTKHGDIAAYAGFVKEHLFPSDGPAHELTVPPDRSEGPAFANKLWLPLLDIFLFPVKVTLDETYEPLLSEKAFHRLMRVKHTSFAYREKSRPKTRLFHVPTAIDPSHTTQWRLTVFEEKERVHVFTLPEPWFSTISGDHGSAASTSP